jgi:branched-chain amino acid transport system ATP-binding protein
MLTIENVYAGYIQEIDILQGVSLKVDSLSVTLIIGPNGSGKSTLLKTIYGFIKPKIGKIYFNGEEITGLSPHTLSKKGIGYILQERSIFPYMTVEENLKVALYGVGKYHDEKALRDIYELFPALKERRHQLASTLSGGQQRMLEIARCLIIDPKLILIDEPSAGLAPKIVGEVYSYMSHMIKEREVTILLVDQNIKAGMSIANEIYIMNQGKISARLSASDKDRVEEIVKTWFKKR